MELMLGGSRQDVPVFTSRLSEQAVEVQAVREILAPMNVEAQAAEGVRLRVVFMMLTRCLQL
jgi:hypothetical protein